MYFYRYDFDLAFQKSIGHLPYSVAIGNGDGVKGSSYFIGMKAPKQQPPLPSPSVLPSRIADQQVLIDSLDLERVRPLLESLYSRTRGGRRPYDPVLMLRDMLWMHFADYAFNAWSREVRRNATLARCIGFTETTPAVSTRYSFCYRLLDGPPDGRPRLSSASNHSRFLRNLAAEKQQRTAKKAQQADASEALSTRLHRRLASQLQAPLPDSFLGRVFALLGALAIEPSAQRGLFDSNSDVAIDGSLVASQASSRGHRLPDGLQKTLQEELQASARFYSDPTATWGYCASKDRYVFGYRLHAAIVVTPRHQLPVALSIAPGHLSDIEMGMTDMAQLVQYQHHAGLDLHIQGVLADKGYDACGFHRLIIAAGMDPLVPLRKIPHQDAEQIPRNEEGVPLCPAGLPMRYHGYNKRGHKHTYNCPVKRPTHKDGRYTMKSHPHECPHGQLCEPDSKMGPVCHLRTKDNPRLNPRILRDSDEFKERFKQRSSAERFFSYVKGADDKRRYRRQHLVLLHALSKAIRLHAMAWQDG